MKGLNNKSTINDKCFIHNNTTAWLTTSLFRVTINEKVMKMMIIYTIFHHMILIILNLSIIDGNDFSIVFISLYLLNSFIQTRHILKQIKNYNNLL